MDRGYFAAELVSVGITAKVRDGRKSGTGGDNTTTKGHDYMARKVIDLTGKQFGRWTVVMFAGTPKIGGHPQSVWLCRCTCGTERLVGGDGLRKGTSKSCNCANPGRYNLHRGNVYRGGRWIEPNPA